jgi:hypothetical protein
MSEPEVEAVLAERRRHWVPPPPRHGTGILSLYSRVARSPSAGAACGSTTSNDGALYRALTEGWIAGAGVDDLAEEPAKLRDWKPSNPLFALDNVIITPHGAYYSEEAIRTDREFAAEEVVRVLGGKPALSPVNTE